MSSTRKQTLPKELWTCLNPKDTSTYCFWYENNQLKKCQVTSVNKARNFIEEAKKRNVGAFASTFVEQESENQVFACSYEDILKKYEFKDWIALEIASANYKLIHYPAEKAVREAHTRSVEQWDSKNYNLLYDNAEYHVSWYNTTKHRFEEKVFTKFKEANVEFTSKKTADIPVRLTECLIGSKKIHEVKAACQHWHIGMGNYLEQIAKKTLPIGEIPYAFSNNYLTSEIKVENGYGYLEFRVGFDSYSIQIGRVCNDVSIMIDDAYTCKTIKYIIIQDNPVMKPWIAKIERGW